jgi:tetratricopeptide (TPR) repeat protein
MRRPRGLFAVLAVAVVFVSCSSAPKPPDGVFDERNKAAELAKMGDGFMAKGQYASALQYYEDALKSGSSVDDLEGVAASHASMGRAYLAAGEADAAKAEYEASLDYASMAGSGAARAVATAGLGEVAYAAGAKEAALASFEEATALAGAAVADKAKAEKAAAEKALAIALHDGAMAKAALGRRPEAIADLQRAQAMNLEAKRWTELGANRYALASILSDEGRPADALAAALGALDADKRAESARAVPGDLAAAARLSAKLEKDAEAWGYWRRSFDSAMSVDDAVAVRKALNALIALAPKLRKDAEGTRYSALLAKLDEAEGRARGSSSP